MKSNYKSLYVSLALIGLISTGATAQVNVEDEASDKTPFKLLWGFDTGG